MTKDDLRTNRSGMVARLSTLLSAVALTVICSQQPIAANYSDWEIQGLYGAGFKEPGATGNTEKGIITIQNASGWDWGSSYFFVDTLHSFHNDDGNDEVYGEWYPTLSLGWLTDSDLSLGPVRDVGFTMGINAGRKDKSTNDSKPLVYLPGFTTDFKVPGFNLLSLGTYAYMDRGKTGDNSNGCQSTTYQVTPSWAIPFGTDSWKFSFEGFADFIGNHAGCSFQIVSQPQLRLDLGNFWGKPNWLFAGTEYQYWHNKFGIEGLDESFPQALIVMKF